MSYLDHPITANGHYGSASDIERAGAIVYAARCDQATFNLAVLMDPKIHGWNMPYSELPPEALGNRPFYDKHFERCYQAMGFQMSESVTLAGVCLHLQPQELLWQLRNHMGLRAQELLKSQIMRAMIDHADMDDSAELAAMHCRTITSQD